MMIIGCDFHPSWQQVSWMDTETGECGERKLAHAAGEAKMRQNRLVLKRCPIPASSTHSRVECARLTKRTGSCDRLRRSSRNGWHERTNKREGLCPDVELPPLKPNQA